MRRNLLVPLGLATLTAVLVVVFAWRGPPPHPLSARIDDILLCYTGDPPTDRAKAKAAIREIGDEAVPYLETLLQSRMGNRSGAVLALRDLGSERSVCALVKVMAGDTREARTGGAVLIRSVLSKEEWNPTRARSVPGLSEGVTRFLQEASHPFRLQVACDIVALMKLQSARPYVLELAGHPDPKVRRSVADTLRALEASSELPEE